jgi:WD40 repeat protein
MYTATYTLSWTYSNTNSNVDVNAVAFSANASLLAVGMGGNRFRVYTFTSASNASNSLGNTGNTYYCLDYCPDGSLLAAGDDGGNLRFYDLYNNYNNFDTITSLGNLTTLDFSNDSCWLAVGSTNRNVYFYGANCIKNQPPKNPPFRCAIDQYKFNTTKC